MIAKATMETLEARQTEIERQYIAVNHIVNHDGSIPKRIFCIDDEEEFDKANAECSVLIFNEGLENDLNTARDFFERGRGQTD